MYQSINKTPKVKLWHSKTCINNAYFAKIFFCVNLNAFLSDVVLSLPCIQEYMDNMATIWKYSLHLLVDRVGISVLFPLLDCTRLTGKRICALWLLRKYRRHDRVVFMQDLANLMSAAERKRIFFALPVLNKVDDVW